MASFRVFGAVTTLLGIATALLSVWLLASAFTEDCAASGYGYNLNSNINRYRYGYNDRILGASFGDVQRDRYDPRYSGTKHDYYRRDRATFCIEWVANWITAGGIAVGVGMLQLLLSVLLLVKAESRIVAIIYAAGHLIGLSAIVAAFAVGMQGEVHESREIEVVGKLWLGCLALNALVSFVLPCIACWQVFSSRNDDHDARRRYKDQGY